jgi:hypothetical protein
MKKSIAVLAAVVAISLSLSAQDKAILAPSASIPLPDGVVKAKEYQFNSLDGMLYLSIQAATSGWVALGVGGLKMDGSRLFIAYDAGGKQVFTEQTGAGHSHGDAADSIVKKYVVKQSGGTTTLELVVPASAAVAGGKLDLLYSYADTTSFAARHKARGSMEIAVPGIDS